MNYNLLVAIFLEDEIHESDGEEADKQPKLTFRKILIIILVAIFWLTLLEGFVIVYFTFCGFCFLTINIFIYSWLSIFTKEPIQIFLSILVNFSDFGLFFALSLFTFSGIKWYIMFLNGMIDYFITFLKICFSTNKVKKIMRCLYCFQ